MAAAYRKKDVLSMYGISRDVLDKAIGKGELTFKKGGYLAPVEVHAWAKKKGLEAKTAVDENTEVIVAGEKIDQADLDGVQPIVSPDVIRSVMATHFPSEMLQQAASLKDLADSLTKIATATEKQKRNLKDMGRIADTREQQAILDAVIGAMMNDVKTLATQIGTEAARETKMKKPEVVKVLDVATEYLLKQFHIYADELDKRSEEFMMKKTAEAEGRGVRRSK